MNRDHRDALEAALAQLRAVPTPEPPAAMEARVMAAIDDRRSRRLVWTVPASALAALTLAVLAIHRPSTPPHPADTPFFEIPYTAPLAPYERTEVKRMDVPVAALIAAGFEIDAPDTGATLRADVLFGQDGRAHAIRIIQ